MSEYAFIHIPKNAGMSFKKTLKDNPKIKYFGHDVLFKNIESTKNIYVIREPVDRFTSAFFYLKRYPKNIRKDFYKTPDEMVDALLNLDPRSLMFMKVHEHDHIINGKKIPTDWVFSKQSYWIHKPHRFLLYDNLNEEVINLGKDLDTGLKMSKINDSKRIDFTYSEDSLQYLKLAYKSDFLLYNFVKESKNKIL